MDTENIEFLDEIFKDIDKTDFQKFDKKKFLTECKKYVYIPITFPPQDRIIVIGDLHGSYDLTISALKIAKVIDNDKNWIGKNTFIVQCGDQIDSCRPDKYKCDHPEATINDKPDDIKILHFFTSLNKKAMKSGGRVISLLGNHELMNVLGNINYVSYENLKALSKKKNYKKHEKYQLQDISISPEKKYAYDIKIDIKEIESYITSGEDKRRELFEPGNKYGKFLACTRISVLVIGSFLFVHGGIIPDFTKKLNIKNKYDLYKLNYIIRKWLLGLIDNKMVARTLNKAKESMFWNRILGELPEKLNKNDPKCIEYLDPVLKIFKIKKMIIGHTPQYFHNNTGINSTCGERVWRVDVGYSHAFDGFDEEYNKFIQIIFIFYI